MARSFELSIPVLAAQSGDISRQLEAGARDWLQSPRAGRRRDGLVQGKLSARSHHWGLIEIRW
jgi:hypothetical protein